MTPFACSIHTHATCCDGKNTLAEMAAAAYAAGVQYNTTASPATATRPSTWTLATSCPPI